MDYEKKYKEALKRAKEFMSVRGVSPDEDAFECAKELSETIFPELKESEDEKIRKALIKYFSRGDIFDGLKCSDIVAWLEKRGEQKPVEHLELKAGHWYICHRAFCCRADHLTVKEGERFMCEKDGVVKGFVIKEPEKYFKEVCAPAPMEDVQNPVEMI